MLETPTTGQVYLNGELLYDAAEAGKLSEADLRLKRLHFGLVFQNFNLFPQYNVKQNVTLAPKLLHKSLTAKRVKELRKKQFLLKLKLKKTDEIKTEIEEINRDIDNMQAELKNTLSLLSDKADALLTRVGLTEKANSYPCELSGGQCQRVAIARALALEPDILCFDEPTSALDPELTGEVLKVIKGLKSGDTTMIVVTHEMEFARNVADKIIFMADGVIEEVGTPEEVFGNPQSEKTRAFLQKAEEEI